MGRMFWTSWRGVFEALKSFLCVGGGGKSHLSHIIFPLESHSTIFLPCPILVVIILILWRCFMRSLVSDFFVFYTEVINEKTKCDWFCVAMK